MPAGQRITQDPIGGGEPGGDPHGSQTYKVTATDSLHQVVGAHSRLAAAHLELSSANALLTAKLFDGGTRVGLEKRQRSRARMR